MPAEVFLGDADFILISAELTFGSYTHKGLWEMNEKKKGVHDKGNVLSSTIMTTEFIILGW